MPTYILLTTLTAQGVQTLRSNPDRLREVNRDVEELGARVVHQWATLGPFDFLNVVEAPDDATIARVSVARTRTTNCASGYSASSSSSSSIDATPFSRSRLRPSKSTKSRPTCGLTSALPIDTYIPLPS